MRSIISQSVVLPAPAERLFAMYIDPAKHAAITGAPVAISAEPGAPFQAFNGALTGAILQIIPRRLAVPRSKASPIFPTTTRSTGVCSG